MDSHFPQISQRCSKGTLYFIIFVSLNIFKKFYSAHIFRALKENCNLSDTLILKIFLEYLLDIPCKMEFVDIEVSVTDNELRVRKINKALPIFHF